MDQHSKNQVQYLPGRNLLPHEMHRYTPQHQNTQEINDVDVFKDGKTIPTPIQGVDKGPDLNNISQCQVERSTPKERVKTGMQSQKRYDPISKKKLNEFQCLVRSLPVAMPFKKAWRQFLPLRKYFSESCETELEIEVYFDQARESLPKLKILPKIEDSGFFSVPCSINGWYIEDALCNSGIDINIITEEAADRLKLKKMMHPTILNIKLANGTIVSPIGEVKNVPLLFGSCQVPTDFQVINMEYSDDVPLVLGRSFLATSGAVMDWPNKRISLTNIDKDIFYPLAPLGIRAKPIQYVRGEKKLLDKKSCGYLSEEDDEDVLKKPPIMIDLNLPYISYS